MAWTKIIRRKRDKRGLRYASDYTDAEWALIVPFIDIPNKVGRPRQHLLSPVWDAVQYIATTGCQWPLLSKDFPPFTTVQHYFYRWRDSGLIVLINEALAVASRLIEGRAETPTAAIIDSQSVKTTESGGARGYDAGTKIKGRKRHIVTDTAGNVLDAVVHTADIQDRDGAPGLIKSVCHSFSTLVKLFADGGYAGQKLAAALSHIEGLALEIVKRSDRAEGFVILAKRWTVERTFAWLNQCHRLATDWETSIASSQTWLLVASIRRMTRAIAATE